MRRMICALALMMLATPAFADPAEDGATAGALIAESRAQGVFELLAAEANTIVVRHPRSGLICRLGADNANRLLIFPQAARGEDVACETNDGSEYVTLYATRFTVEAPLDELMRGIEAAVRHRFPEAQPVSGARASGGQRALHFLVMQDGVRYYTGAYVAQHNGWTIKLRYSAPAPDAEALQRGQNTAALAFQAAFSEVRRQPNL
ncbi:MAG: hypothetical protein R3C16_08580 [Hyphomonadaceae bacterium]